MHFCLLPLSLFAIVFTGGFSLVDDLTAFDLGDPFLTIDSNLASNDLLAWDDSPMGETSLGTNNKNNDDLFPPWTESESLDLDDDLLTADSCPSTNNGLSRRNDDNTHPACSTTPNNQVKVPDLPTTLDDLTNQINYPSFPRLHVVDPVVRDLMRSNVQLLDEKNCVPDSPFYLCCLCDPNAAFMVCLDCVPVITLKDGCYAPYMEMCCPVYGLDILDQVSGADSLDEWEREYRMSFDRNPGPQGGTVAVLCTPASQ